MNLRYISIITMQKIMHIRNFISRQYTYIFQLYHCYVCSVCSSMSDHQCGQTAMTVIFFGANLFSVKAISMAITNAVKPPFRTTVYSCGASWLGRVGIICGASWYKCRANWQLGRIGFGANRLAP